MKVEEYGPVRDAVFLEEILKGRSHDGNLLLIKKFFQYSGIGCRGLNERNLREMTHQRKGEATHAGSHLKGMLVILKINRNRFR